MFVFVAVGDLGNVFEEDRRSIHRGHHQITQFADRLKFPQDPDAALLVAGVNVTTRHGHVFKAYGPLDIVHSHFGGLQFEHVYINLDFAVQGTDHVDAVNSLDIFDFVFEIGGVLLETIQVKRPRNIHKQNGNLGDIQLHNAGVLGQIFGQVGAGFIDRVLDFLFGDGDGYIGPEFNDNICKILLGIAGHFFDT